MFVSVNAIRPQRRARTREAIGEIRHVFLDADKDGDGVLKAIGERRDLPLPSYVIRSSPGRLHVLWQVTGFTKEGVEALQKRLAGELGTDKAATSCAQLTRLPGFLNHKYTPGCEVTTEYGDRVAPVDVRAFPADRPAASALRRRSPAVAVLGEGRRAGARPALHRQPSRRPYRGSTATSPRFRCAADSFGALP